MKRMVRLSRGYEALLYPYVDSKGNFGKAYSRDMAYAASRYTEVKLDEDLSGAVLGYRQGHRGLCGQLRQHHEGAHAPAGDLPVGVLVNANTGIAVGMASSICPFNLAEVCETTIALMRDPGA